MIDQLNKNMKRLEENVDTCSSTMPYDMLTTQESLNYLEVTGKISEQQAIHHGQRISNLAKKFAETCSLCPR